MKRLRDELELSESREKMETPKFSWRRTFYVYDREKHWKDVVVENNGEKKRVHSLRWEIHIKYKEELKNRYFPVVVTNLKGGIIIWTCGKDNIVGED